MSDKDFKEKLVKILEEEDEMVLKYLKKIFTNLLDDKNQKDVNNSMIEKLQSENKDLQSELLQMKTQADEKNIEIEKLNLNLKERDSEINLLKNRFKIEEELFREYNSITGSLKEELEGVFKGDTIEEFICCGVQPKNIDSLWEIAKKSILEDEKDWEKTVQIFKYFFDSFNKTYSLPLYVSLNTRLDNKFEEDFHLSKNIASGYIERVYLDGYSDRNEKIIKKAIVSLY